MLPVLVMVAAFSRIAAVLLPPRQTMDLVAGMWQLLSGRFAALPHELWWDNEARHWVPWPADRAGDRADGRRGSRLVQYKPYLQSKGIVERANRYLETSFLPGRDFNSPANLNNNLSRLSEHLRSPDYLAIVLPGRAGLGGELVLAVGLHVEQSSRL